jgi:hypothetical protein
MSLSSRLVDRQRRVYQQLPAQRTVDVLNQKAELQKSEAELAPSALLSASGRNSRANLAGLPL